GDKLTRAAGDRRRARAIAGEAPDRGAQHASTIERESGQQVEDRDLQVHLTEHLRDGDRGQEPWSAEQRVRELRGAAKRCAGDDQARRGTGHGHEELALRARRLLRERRKASGQEARACWPRTAETDGRAGVAGTQRREG